MCGSESAPHGYTTIHQTEVDALDQATRKDKLFKARIVQWQQLQ